MILLNSPHMCGREKDFIEEAFCANWIAPMGKNVTEFENELCANIGAGYAVALSSGTAAIHLGLKYLGVGSGDIVFCSTFTFSASCNPILYLGATPVFIDSEYQSFNMCPESLKKAYEKYPNPKAVVVVNLYGNPANYDALLAITKAHNTSVLEDSAESLGSKYKGISSGNFGDVSVFSFNGNKIITTSGGGMAIVKSREAKDKLTFWATQSRENQPWYEHKEVGYNYRLSNICAGIGRGQLTALDERVRAKKVIYNIYKEKFKNSGKIQMIPIPEGCECNHWMSVITLSKDCKIGFMELLKVLGDNRIESRPTWKPLHMQPIFAQYDFVSINGKESVSEDLFSRSLCLPSDTKLSRETIERVADIILDAVI